MSHRVPIVLLGSVAVAAVIGLLVHHRSKRKGEGKKLQSTILIIHSILQ
jgi:hypothetical protein